MIRPADQKDISAIAEINKQGFSGNAAGNAAKRWVKANFAQREKYRYFVVEADDKVTGYIGWEIKGGFMRKTPVVELQQLAVLPDFRGKGIGTGLINESLPQVKLWIKQVNPAAEKVRIFVWTKKDNGPAKKIYQKISNLDRTYERNIYDSDEIMLLGEHRL